MAALLKVDEMASGGSIWQWEPLRDWRWSLQK